ncbi:mas-related G-protein coupled receptor member X4-like [Notamacropus eugenii]|uniref:mas-related G-protein coupled receptor member X4-like n=1 Tax=Notamacropus eugenii TaxID=9315 RepID=UPI003B67D776
MGRDATQCETKTISQSTPGQLEYPHDNATERSVNASLVHLEPERFYCHFWILILTVLIAILGLLGHSIVLWLLGYRIQRNPFSVYILNLARADTLFLCFSFLNYMNELLRFISSHVIVEVGFCLQYMFFVIILSLLAVISTECFLSVLFPIWYRYHRPKNMSATLCTVLWAMVILLSAVGYAFCLHTFSDPVCDKTIIIFLFVWFIVLTCTLCVSSLTLLLRVQCSSQCQQLLRLYFLVLLTVLVFLLCGLPIGISNFTEIETLSPFLPYWFPPIMTCVNSSVNPIIYFFLGNQKCRRREPLREVLQRALGDEEVGGGTRGTPHINTPETSFSG